MIEPKSVARTAALLGISLLIAAPAIAHHSFAKFDRQRSIELEGELAEVRWQNPHVQFTLPAAGPTVRSKPGGSRRTRRASCAAPASAPSSSRWAIASKWRAIPPSTAASSSMQRICCLRTAARCRWALAARRVSPAARSVTAEPGPSPRATSRARSSACSASGAPRLSPGALLFPDMGGRGFTVLDYPLTPEARRAVQAFDSVAGSQRLANDCTPKGMPWIMEQPYDLAFERSGDDVVLKLEEFDVARRVRMEWQGDRAAQPFTPHGFSTGAWQGLRVNDVLLPWFLIDLRADPRRACRAPPREEIRPSLSIPQM